MRHFYVIPFLCYLSLCLLQVDNTSIEVNAEENTNSTITINNLIYHVTDSDYELIGVQNTDVTSITIPATLNEKNVFVYDNVFSDCKMLKEINVENGNISVSSNNGVLFNSTENILLAFPPAKEIESYVVPQNTEMIETNAFCNCKNLHSVTIPFQVNSKSGAFRNCSELKVIFGSLRDDTQERMHIAYECPNLTSVQAGGKYSYINLGAFPMLNDAQFDPDTVISKEFRCSNEYLTELIVPFFENEFSTPSCIIKESNNLESLNFKNTLKYDSLQISDCVHLKEIAIDGTQDHIHGDVLILKNLPELKSITIYEKYTDNFSLEINSCNEFTIYSYSENTSLISYCSQNSIPFIALESLDGYNNGDVNEDGKIDILDVITINKAILGKEHLTDSQNKVADVNKNDKVDSSDSLMILKYIVGLINSFDV